MFTADLEDISHWYYLDGNSHKYLAIGWLGTTVPQSGPRPSEKFLRNIQLLAKYNYVEDGELGCHTCEICHKIESHGSFYVQTDGFRYLAPLMLEHYIVRHNYLPPQEFIRSVESFEFSDEA